MPPILYSSSTPRDVVSQLKTDALKFEKAQGFLKSLLAELKVPESSQTLVFSKTSLQKHKIWPNSPRALYFNDDVYIGWVKGGDVIEISAVDPQLGAVFYTLDQKPNSPPVFARQTHRCLQCHDSNAFTRGVPGHIVRSVFPDSEGMPHFNMGTHRITDRSPFNERWGGWYVTGTHGSMRHMGNVLYKNEVNPDMFLYGELGANKADLAKYIPVENYLSPGSDIVALLVLEHQTTVHNLITRANHETRVALRQSDEINKLTKTPLEQLTDGAKSRLRANCDPLLEALLFVEEPRLPDPVKGSSNFAAEFAARGPFDPSGRSLRQFDLQKRMFKHPCSYLIYSKAFAGLPTAAKNYLSERMWQVLSGKDASKEFQHLTPEDRTAVAEILKATLPEFCKDWK